MQKLYCYVDETGQDTKGKLFLVCVIILTKGEREDIEKRLFDIEKETGKGLLKWGKTNFKRRIAYLRAILKIKQLYGCVFYSCFENTKAYVPSINYALTQAILSKGRKNYQTTVIIDGLNKREEEKVSKKLKALKIKYRKVRGARDESSPLIRLADTLAGFFRDWKEKQPYTKDLYRLMVKRGFVKEIYK
jgi:hypothetical protein